MFRVADRLIDSGGCLDKFEISTYKYLFRQLNDKQKERIVCEFGENLTFLNE